MYIILCIYIFNIYTIMIAITGVMYIFDRIYKLAALDH